MGNFQDLPMGNRSLDVLGCASVVGEIFTPKVQAHHHLQVTLELQSDRLKELRSFPIAQDDPFGTKFISLLGVSRYARQGARTLR
jgi:hypothetical protein